MILKNELLFYNPSKFREIKRYYDIFDKEILTITEYIINEGLVNDQFGVDIVIDISSLYNLSSSQFQAERIINLFDNTFTFIADIKYKKEFTEDFRFCFDEFIDFDEFISKDEDSKKVLIKKEHKKIIDLDVKELNLFFEKFNNSLYGHNKFKDDFKEAVDSFRVFNKLGEHKILSLFLMGDSGVGKTEVARAIHKSLGGENKLAKVNFGNYSSDNSLNSLIGSPRGYIGSEDGEIFIRVDGSDTGVILIDEFEKSNSTLFNYFLDVLENGKMVSSLSHEIDLNGFIIIFTSNISKEGFKEVISPELRSRLDYKGYFSILKATDKLRYVEFRINSIVNKFNKFYPDALDDDFKFDVLIEIDVNKYKNMRDLNKRIKQVFVEKLMYKMY
ncbi:AAA domain (Cdc48 subfamily) [Epilithonimonas bovis DSM 19482]|uniref:AAA domain (Cdc48 subfamily) n=1 Tax=Epilithonimonas bovis DSM 19482 TaxID=1121284 RepID=A0A1U7PSV5_9FLAO|nr:AAA family ATPase [Epilithonimonas bovis]SIT96646.1 AAA domain (Cdc48 subfamily) [Epilithonimonas bovis DSM 19482]